MTLPITAILPTRNAMGSIEAHVQASREWLSQVAQIVVVDSSEDGTLDYLRAEIDLAAAEFYSRPKGLYEGWNFGVRQAREEFVYFSTVGDTITLEGLQYLLEVAREQSADIVLSPPEMLQENGEPQPNVRWPIHALCEKMRTRELHVFTPAEALLNSLSYLPETILGSSASNLYRRTFMVENPFPEAWGHCADSAWMVSNALKARMALATRPVARFVIHAKEAGVVANHLPTSEHFDDFFTRAERGVADSEIDAGDKEILAGWIDGFKSRHEKNIQSIEARNRRIRHYEEKIAHLTGRVATVQSRAAEYENQLRESNAKVIDLRRKVWHFEQAHRSILRVLGLYLSAKGAQMRNAGAWLRQKIKS